MSKERIVLGIDIGIGSVSGGLVKLQEEPYAVETESGEPKYKIAGGKIIYAGVRTFQPPQDRQKKSLALIRGSARRTRRTIKRKAQRMRRFVRLGKEFKLIDNDFNWDDILKPKKGDNKKEKWDIWRIRKEAIERKLTDTELFRVLYHIAKHRGAYFHTKAEELEKPKDPEKAKVKAGLERIRNKLKESKFKTVGAMFYEIFKQTNPDNKRKRNTKDKYENSIRRELLHDEITEIFKQQQKLGNQKANDELKLRYIDEVLMHEEGIDEEKLQRMMSGCEFVPGEKCAPKESWTAERFNLFNRLNNLSLIDKNNGQKVPFEKDEREEIEALAKKNAKVTFAQLRTELGRQDKLNLRFNLCSYAEKNPEYKKKIECEVKNGQPQFEDKHKLSIVNIETGECNPPLNKETKDIFTKRFNDHPTYNKIYVYYSDIRKQLNLPDNFRFADLDGYTKSVAELERDYEEKNKNRKNKKPFNGEAGYIKQFEDKDVFVELKGYHKIKGAIEKLDGKWDKIKDDGDTLDTIAEALTYCKSDKTRTAYLKEHGITDEKVIDAVLTLNMKDLANFSKAAMRNLLNYMDGDGESHLLFHEAKEKCGYGKPEYDKQAILKPYNGFFEKNPVVARTISQTRKMINAILRKYNDKYPIDEIHIEVATELANSEERKIDIAQGQKRYREAKEAAAERCGKWNINPEEGQNLLMFRLAEEQGNFCPYTGKKIMFAPTTGKDAVYVLECEIDHIIPMSRSFNDSLNNKVLCSPEANQNKRDRIPFEWFEERFGRDSEQWRDFENRVKKMYGMPFAKKKNLLKKSWTDEDKEKFLKRNLNDTRYAARHIADYLRKYFDFTKSKREDINSLSRIQVRSGGITAFLRHMWGLNKDREKDDLHHATDALVVACSTYGHVYLVSNLAKEIERKGKNWYKHFGKDKFKPWESIREDIENTVKKIFVSKMPRHKVTAAAHADTVSSLKTDAPKKRHIKINKGYAEIGEMVRADVFTDVAGKNYVVPIYAEDMFRKKPLPDKYVPDERTLPYEQWPSVFDKDLKFRFSLFKDDLISINDKIYYVGFFEATTANVNVNNIDGSMFPDKKDAQDPYTKKICYRPKSRTRKCVLKKYSVDMLGNYKEVKEEKRLGNEGVKRTKIRKKNGKK